MFIKLLSAQYMQIRQVTKDVKWRVNAAEVFCKSTDDIDSFISQGAELQQE